MNEALRARGADHFDAVAWRVIEAMLRRLDDLPGAARTALQRKIARRLAALRERFERAGDDAPERAADAGPGNRSAKESAQGRPAAGPLAELLAHVARHSGIVETSAGPDPGAARSGAALKSLRYFRSTWSRISLEQQLSRALAQAPDNAGPLNSHFLVLQALIRMRDVAPAYLEGFIAHAEALHWLEQADGGQGRAAVRKPAARKGEVRIQGARTRRPARGRAG